MTLIEALSAVRDDADVFTHTRFSLVKLAIYVTREDPGAADHAERLALARAILVNVDAYYTRFSLGIIANQVLLGVTDPDFALDAATIDTQVNAIYSSYYL